MINHLTLKNICLCSIVVVSLFTVSNLYAENSIREMKMPTGLTHKDYSTKMKQFLTEKIDATMEYLREKVEGGHVKSPERADELEQAYRKLDQFKKKEGIEALIKHSSGKPKDLSVENFNAMLDNIADYSDQEEKSGDRDQRGRSGALDVRAKAMFKELDSYVTVYPEDGGAVLEHINSDNTPKGAPTPESHEGIYHRLTRANRELVHPEDLPRGKEDKDMPSVKGLRKLKGGEEHKRRIEEWIDSVPRGEGPEHGAHEPSEHMRTRIQESHPEMPVQDD